MSSPSGISPPVALWRRWPMCVHAVLFSPVREHRAPTGGRGERLVSLRLVADDSRLMTTAVNECELFSAPRVDYSTRMLGLGDGVWIKSVCLECCQSFDRSYTITEPCSTQCNTLTQQCLLNRCSRIPGVQPREYESRIPPG